MSDDVAKTRGPRPKSKKSLVAALLVIVLLIASIAALTYIPNQFVKTSPWLSIDYLEFETLPLLVPDFVNLVETWHYYTFLLVHVGLHNPTHAIHSITLNLMKWELILVDEKGRVFRTKYGQSTDPFWSRETGNVATLKLAACTPSYSMLVFLVEENGSLNLSSADQISISLDLNVSIDGTPAVLTSQASARQITSRTVAITETSTTAGTTLVSTTSLPSPNECVFPWI